nr:MAG TPA: hypothetical protein [Bacteriophage sp.]
MRLFTGILQGCIIMDSDISQLFIAYFCLESILLC